MKAPSLSTKRTLAGAGAEGAAVATDQGALNLKQVAAELGVHYMTAYRYVRQGRLEATREEQGWVVSRQALDLFLQVRDQGAGITGTGGATHEVDWAARLEPALLAGDEPTAWQVIEAAMAGGRTLPYCYTEVLGRALSLLGARWETGEVTVAEQYLATSVAERLVSRMGAHGRRPGRTKGAVVFGAPLGELHRLPVSIAADLIRIAGFQVLELGVNVPAEAFALAAQRARDLVAVGIGIATIDHLESVEETVEAVQRAAEGVPVIVGGRAVPLLGPARDRLRGVSGWAEDGPDAVRLIQGFRSAQAGRG